MRDLVKDLVIFGEGGFAKEVSAMTGCNTLIGVDEEGTVNPNKQSVAIAIGNSRIRESIANRFSITEFPIIIAYSAKILKRESIQLNEGTVICHNCILT